MTDLADHNAPAHPTHPNSGPQIEPLNMEPPMNTPAIDQRQTQSSPEIGTDADAAQRAKVEQLHRRRAARPGVGSAGAPTPASMTNEAPARRAGPAQGSKIAAAGLGMATMLGLVAAMGFASTSSASTPPIPLAPLATVPPAQVVVVIHPGDATTATAAVPGLAGVVAVTPSQPIVLSAQPVVQQAPATQASPSPAGQTNGSR